MMNPDTSKPKKSVQEILKNQKVVLGFAGVACFVFLALAVLSPKKELKPAGLGDNLIREPQETYSKTEIEKLIKDQLAKEKEKQIEEPASTPPPKRKLGAKIAVFLKTDENKKEKLFRNEKEESGLGISTGTKVGAYLANSIFSFNVTSPVIAVSSDPFIKDGKIVIPKGTQFIGEAGIVQSRDRVNIKFNTMVFPDGKEIGIRAMALSLDGSGGVKGKVDKQMDRSIFKAAGEIVLSGASLVLGTRSNSPMTLEDELRLNASRNLANDAGDALQSVKVEKSIAVDAYTPIEVLFLSSL